MGLEDEALKLAANDFELESLPIEELSALDLSRSMGKKLTEYGPAWVGPYTLLLAGDMCAQVRASPMERLLKMATAWIVPH